MRQIPWELSDPPEIPCKLLETGAFFQGETTASIRFSKVLESKMELKNPLL